MQKAGEVLQEDLSLPRHIRPEDKHLQTFPLLLGEEVAPNVRHDLVASLELRVRRRGEHRLYIGGNGPGEGV